MSQPIEQSIVQKKGNVNKCPSCGAQVGAFASACESCGHEFNEIAANRTIAALVARFDEIEKEAYSNTQINESRRTKIIIEKRSRTIRDFPIPNAREDLQQLLYYIQPKLIDTARPDSNIEDWRTKFSEVLSRAKNAYKNDAAALAEFTKIENSLQSTLSESIIIKAKRNPLFVALVLGLLAIGLFVLISALIDHLKIARCDEAYANAAKNEQSRLDSLFIGAEQILKNEQYSEAKSAVAKLHWELQDGECKVDTNQRSKDLWDSKRTQLEATVSAELVNAASETAAAADRHLAELQIEADKVAALAQAEASKVASKAAAATAKARAKVDAAEKIERDNKW